MSSLTSPSPYKPFSYPWAFEAWKKQQQIHWLPEEVPMADDMSDFAKKLTTDERTLLTNIFRFFTQADIDVSTCYMTEYAKVFRNTEVSMMLSAFANTETIHIHAYAFLIESLNLPDKLYTEFQDYSEMRAKHDFSTTFNCNTVYETALCLACFGGFTEGLQLFGTFAILMNFPRFNKLKGMGQIITWSIRDESLHVESIIKLFHTFVDEKGLDKKKLQQDIKKICEETLKLEFAFLELVFKTDIEGLTLDDVKSYLRCVANLRLNQLGIDAPTLPNPLSYMDFMLTVQHANFFEARSTEYSKATVEGDEW